MMDFKLGPSKLINVFVVTMKYMYPKEHFILPFHFSAGTEVDPRIGRIKHFVIAVDP